MEDFNGMVLPERSLHLFAGAGGGILGDLLLGREVVGAVECEKYQREVLFQRQADGILPRFPVWDDVTTFRLDNGETESYIRWLQEIRDDLTVCGGFPCQDVSVANKNAKGLDGERSGLWTEMLRIIGEIRPRCVFVENSPALIVRGFDRVLGDLTQIGYDCRWAVIGADDVGAPHQRKRFWLLGQKGGGYTYSDSTRCERLSEGRVTDSEGWEGSSPVSASELRVLRDGRRMEDSDQIRHREGQSMETLKRMTEGDWLRPSGQRMQLTLRDQVREPGLYPKQAATGKLPVKGNLNPDWVEWLMGWPVGWTDLKPLSMDAVNEWMTRMLRHEWWNSDPGDDGSIPRLTECNTHRLRRIECLGNGQVPLCVRDVTLAMEEL